MLVQLNCSLSQTKVFEIMDIQQLVSIALNNKESPNNRAAAVEHLIDMQAWDALKPLMTLKNDKSPLVRTWYAIFLVYHPNQGLIYELVEWLKFEDDGGVVERVIQAAIIRYQSLEGDAMFIKSGCGDD